MIRTIRHIAGETPALAADPRFAATLAVEARLPREQFVPKAARRYVYFGTPLRIGWEQTISDPYIMAVMTAAAGIDRGSNVLEIGTGSGYQAAVLAELGARVATIEIVPQLATRAATTLRRRGYRNVTSRTGDGFAGWSDRAPFDAILVTAGAARVPQPLLDQLRVGGRLVMPIGPSTATEHLQVYLKRADGAFDVCSLGWAMFVPLTGRGNTPDRPGIGDRTIRWCYGAPVT
ncbi:protein-L-isoaspartate O-methyltransferase [Sphingomonas sp. S-NIH.Pt1_0416]|uniref:protein-L-isoaspartate(D-aspartate) O-methyltransferase n=1 Tax=Sphingomonas sp. S-NIH.Pt1_0416 TaxID=1920123 RepID=UPI000F7D835D|nr:protein-L-isoaspartate(D-aspartate) O-methyltransferase [Sphingomonas sp. S-NIH.Pt1_0416]RSU65272.1 protein-L-isoaspartate O-methyltransferase [Sphingomonas sp. S-NIH.Pt1_0416]